MTTFGHNVNRTQRDELLTHTMHHANKILTDGEEVAHVAVQQKPIVNLHPQGVVVTNKRVIKYKPSWFGATFQDFLWRDIEDVHLSDRFFGSYISFVFKGGQIYATFLPKDQAKKVYAYAQEREEEWVEKKCLRKIEEDRAQSGANHIIVGNNDSEPGLHDDMNIREKLVELKKLLDDKLITQDEYQTKKEKILHHM